MLEFICGQEELPAAGRCTGGFVHFGPAVNLARQVPPPASMIELTNDPIDTEALLREVASPLAGAAILFVGVTREVTGERQTASLDYECYAEMAIAKLTELRAAACDRWPLTGCAIVHRLGHLGIGEASVGIAVSSPHRREAFEAGQWLIDTLKESVPIWKKENWADGTTEWVHPGLTPPASELDRPL